ncbi:MFS transporter [Actinomadura rayongensis]|uniref:MFS transporter n=1 Tax=Actinomadura rayongensis TaxID=1429076 RepID=A0A6I4WC22_9ACTN|nr:MFS transporter [Actinomadura rayongensis]MXQ64292.1 MFS transporter [Actinomadura rayongensis]
MSTTPHPTPTVAPAPAHGLPLMLAMVIPAQLLAITGIIGGAVQPHIAQHFHTTEIAWFSLASALVTLVSVPFAMKFADIYGKRRVMLLLAVAGLAGDVVAALAPSYPVLLAGRMITGLYGPVVALIHAAVREYFPPRRIATAYGVVTGSIGVITLAGPPATGRLVDAHGWRGGMWLLAGLTAFAALMIWRMPETRRRGRFGADFDWAGGLLLGAGVALIVFGVGRGNGHGWTALQTCGPILAGLAALACFVPVELRAARPVVDVRMLSRRPVATVIAAAAFAQFAFVISPAILSFLAQFPHIPGVSDSFGWSTTHYALVGIPAGVATVAAGLAAGALLRRHPPRALWLAGTTVLICGLLLFSQFHGSAGEVIVSGVVTGLGGGTVMACGTAMIVSVITARHQASVNGMAYLLLQVVGGISYQVLFTVLSTHRSIVHGTAFYRDQAFTNGYYFLAALGAVGLLVSLFMPRMRRLADAADDPDDGR